jgi:hypothetical protein
MKIQEIKNKMLQWRDFYGQDIADTKRIKNAKAKEDLHCILSDHVSFLEDQNNDAIRHTEEFERKLGLY